MKKLIAVALAVLLLLPLCSCGLPIDSLKQGIQDSIKDGIKLAAELIDSGKALETLEKLIVVSNRAEA